ncbi:hypothetical protein [Streptomyces ossamyceticus]|uniref:hypothetical protein n=2 Tax=Streptomyces ossamyceticus TaxID=249581 RepID=UPI0006E444C0
MSHLMLRSAAALVLAATPLIAAVPAQAAPQQQFPCQADIQKTDSNLTSTVTLTVTCDVDKTVGARIAIGETVLVDLQQTVRANVEERLTLTIPRVPRVCATLQVDEQTSTVCTP